MKTKRVKRIVSLLRPLEESYGVSNKTKDMIKQALKDETKRFNQSKQRSTELSKSRSTLLRINDFGIENKLKSKLQS
jgi:hypothetical protein